MILNLYTIYRTATGEIVGSLTCDEDSIAANVPADCSIIAGLNSNQDGYIRDGALVQYPARETKFSNFNYETHQWVIDLDAAKADKWTEIKTARTEQEYGGFVWDGSPFDSDALSQQRIIGASQWAGMNSSFTIDWTLADNTVRTLNAEAMMAVGRALGVHVEQAFSKGRDLRTLIDSAQTIAEIDAIQW